MVEVFEVEEQAIGQAQSLALVNRTRSGLQLEVLALCNLHTIPRRWQAAAHVNENMDGSL